MFVKYFCLIFAGMIVLTTMDNKKERFFRQTDPANVKRLSDEGWIPLLKFPSISESVSVFSCEMRSFMVSDATVPYARYRCTETPKSIITLEEIIPFLRSMMAKGLRWPMFTGTLENLLMQPYKVLRFIRLDGDRFTVNTQHFEPVDWKGILEGKVIDYGSSESYSAIRRHRS